MKSTFLLLIAMFITYWSFAIDHENETIFWCDAGRCDAFSVQVITNSCKGYKYIFTNKLNKAMGLTVYAEKKDGNWIKLTKDWILLYEKGTTESDAWRQNHLIESCNLSGRITIAYYIIQSMFAYTVPDSYPTLEEAKKHGGKREKPVIDNGQCIKVSKKYDKACNSNSDIVVTITNVCGGDSFDGKVYIEKKDGTWQSGYFNDLASGKSNSNFWTCNSTGKVIVFRAKHGTAFIDDYPTESEIKEKFATKKYGYGEH